MDRAAAYRKWQTLCRMTVERGCSQAEAEAAARLAARLATRWLTDAGPTTPQADDETVYARAEQRAAQRWHWEYRRCGKPRCRCNDGHLHGPYKYTKRREGQRVRSIYLGRAC